MQEANRLAEMGYMKSREEMGVPSPANEGDQFNPNAGDDKISKEPGFSSNQDDSYEEGLYNNEGNPLKPGGEEDFETMFYRSLNGCEIQSMELEGTVYVDGRKKCVVRDGEKMRPSEDELKTLWKEYVDGEGLYETKVENHEPVDEAEMEEELNEIKRITKQLLGE